MFSINYIVETAGKRFYCAFFNTSQCIFVFISNECDNIEPPVMVQYQSAGDKHEVVKLPHGYLKSSTSYICTKQSTSTDLKKMCEQISSDACIIVENEVGGILNADSSCSKPRR